MVNGHIHYLIIKMEFWAKYPDNILDHSLLSYIRRIVNRFLTIGTVSKVNSSGRPPRSDEIVEDLKEEERDSTNIRSLGVQSVLCMLLNKY
jgi:hypothetical protein